MSDQTVPPSLPNPQPPSPARSLLRAVWRRVENVLFGLALLLVLLYFVLQLSVVQNWLIGKVTAYLSEELHTKVELRHVGLSFFDNVELEGLYIQDLEGDTLLYAEKFSASLNSNIFSLLQNKLEFNEISLTHARVNIQRPENSENNTLQFLLDYFSGSKPKTPSKPKAFRLKIRNLNLTDVVFLKDDQVGGRRMCFEVPKGNIRLNNLDMAAHLVDIRSASFEGFSFTLQDFPEKPLPSEQAVAEAPDTAVIDTTQKRTPLRFLVNRFAITDGRFVLDNFERSPVRDVRPDVIDYDHLKVDQIDIQADSVEFTDVLDFTGRLQNLSAREQSGFELTSSRADHVVVNHQVTALYGTRIQTPGSTLGDTVMFHYDGTYRAYRHFNNEVRMDIRLAEGSRMKLGDISKFSESVAENKFFQNNYDKTADISGRVDGTVNKLNGRDLRIRVGQKAFMQGSFDGDNMARGSDEMRLHFKFDRLQSDFQTIKSIIPGFDPPPYFYRLGNIGYRGTYDLQFSTYHILQGEVFTDIGNGDMSMQLDLSEGREKATYGGYLNLRRFDLAAWTGDSNFGKTTFRFNIDENSTGLTLPTIKAKLEGTIDTFVFKGYTYRNIVTKGTFKEKIFDGTVGVKDPNVDFFFDGTINMRDSVPQFLFAANVNRVDLGALHLVDEDWVLSCKIDQIKLSAREWRDLTGQAKIRNFLLIQDNYTRHKLDSITFVSNYAPSGSRYFGISTDVANAYLEGKFDFRTAGAHLQQLFARQHPDFARRLGLPPNDSSYIDDHYQLSVFIKDSKEFTRLVSPELGPLRNVRIGAEVNALSGKSSLLLDLPHLDYGDNHVDSLRLKWDAEGSRAEYGLVIDTTVTGGRLFRRISLNGVLDNNDLGFRLITSDTSALLKGLSLGGHLSVVDSLWQVQFSSWEIILFDRYWAVEEGNYIRFNANYFEAQSFELFSGDQRILVDNFNQNRGLSLSLANFDLSFLNQFVNRSSFNCQGKIQSLEINISDLYRLHNIQSYIETGAVSINGVSYGRLSGYVETEHLAAPLRWNLNMRYPEQKATDISSLSVHGAWYPTGDSAVTVPELQVSVRPGEFQALVEAEDFPLAVLETFIPGISKTQGRLGAKVLLGGPFSRVEMNGYADIREGQFQIDYLKTPFYLHQERVALSEYRIWAEGDTIWDASIHRNFAIVHGGLLHNHFRDWRLACEIVCKNDKFVALNTLPNDNELFYGKGAGKFVATFGGTFVRTNIDITATTGSETRLFIPISSSADAQDKQFINFIDKTKKDTTVAPKRLVETDLKGLNFDLNLTVTDEAEVQLIFDEQAGDIIKGRGEGDIQFSLNRQGEFKMYGNYFIHRGEYLFTLLNFVNKPFTVTDGGSIAWYGDPFGAQISLDATYTENTSIYNFLREELQLLETTQPDLAQQAGKSTRVVVTMHLKGDLMKPTISFDLDFPNLNGQLKTLVENKLRIMRQDANELNRQVFGLVVVGSFLPGDSGFSSNYLSSAFNTVTQVFTNQLSNYLTGLAAEWFGSTVSSIDFDIAYNDYQNAVTTSSAQGITQAGRELQVRLTSGFVNDRITIQFGSQFGFARPGTNVQEGFLGEDITAEIQLTDSRQWRLKVYQRTEPDVGGGQRRSRIGFGLNFRRDYDSFDEMMSGLTGLLKKK